MSRKSKQIPRVRDESGRLTKEEKEFTRKSKEQFAGIIRIAVPLSLDVYRALVVQAASAEPVMLKPHVLAAQILTKELTR